MPWGWSSNEGPAAHPDIATICDPGAIGMCWCVGDPAAAFRSKDAADGHITKVMRLDGGGFVGPFLKHVLPRHFTRLRSFEFLADTKTWVRLVAIRSARRHRQGRRRPGDPAAAHAAGSANVVSGSRSHCSPCGQHVIHFARPAMTCSRRCRRVGRASSRRDTPSCPTASLRSALTTTESARSRRSKMRGRRRHRAPHGTS